MAPWETEFTPLIGPVCNEQQFNACWWKCNIQERAHLRLLLLMGLVPTGAFLKLPLWWLYTNVNNRLCCCWEMKWLRGEAQMLSSGNHLWLFSQLEFRDFKYLKGNTTYFKHLSLFTGLGECYCICENCCVKPCCGSKGSCKKSDKLNHVPLESASVGAKDYKFESDKNLEM